jgi:general secretion pathway protein K
MRRKTHAQRGIILIAVLFFIALLASGVATFLRRATLDGMIARNRDLASRSEALARGGIQLATALLLQDRLDEETAPLELEPKTETPDDAPAPSSFRSETRRDLWAKIGELEIPTDDGGRLRLRIEDAGSRLNLNALFDEAGEAHEDAEFLLSAFFDKLVEEMQLPDEEKDYDAGELAQNLIDYVDADDVEPDGDPEDDYYQLQRPAYRAANRPLLSIDELGLVEGFDSTLVEAIRPYATVHPYSGGGGINPNTAPAHVLATLFYGISPDYRLADEDTVRRILEMRDGDTMFCGEGANRPGCIPLTEAEVEAEPTPAPTYVTDVFQVTAEASYGDVRRTIEAVIDRSEPTSPLIRSWRVR